MIETRARGRVDPLLDPIGRWLARRGVAANLLTAAGLVISVTGALLVALVDPMIGGFVFLAGSALDALDGPLARADGSAGRRGALLDTVADRIGEIAIWAALVAVVIDDEVAERVTLLAVGVVLTLAGSLLTSFLRARADAAGVDGRSGIFGRAERVILITIGLTTGWIGPMIAVMVVVVWLTVAIRFRSIWRALA